MKNLVDNCGHVKQEHVTRRITSLRITLHCKSDVRCYWNVDCRGKSLSVRQDVDTPRTQMSTPQYEHHTLTKWHHRLAMSSQIPELGSKTSSVTPTSRSRSCAHHAAWKQDISPLNQRSKFIVENPLPGNIPPPGCGVRTPAGRYTRASASRARLSSWTARCLGMSCANLWTKCWSRHGLNVKCI